MKHKLLFLLFLITTQLFSQIKNQSIGFKENKGQIVDQNGKQNNTVKYLLNSNGLNVQLKRNGFSYDIYEVKKTPIASSSTAKTLPYQIPEKGEKEQFNLEYVFHRVDIDFVNSNPKVELITKQKSSDFDNYYNVPNKPEGVLEVHQYKQITYKNIYPNIDAVFTIPEDPQKTVEYNFIIHPKGKISDIQLKFSGAETNLVDNKIQMNVRFGKMEETLPASWIEDGGNKKEIEVEYTKIKKNVYGFSSSNVINGKTVIIDPMPNRLWGTFYGDQIDNHYALEAPAIITDSSGNSYMIGTTTASNSSYATAGAYQTSLATSQYTTANGIIVKFNTSGTRLWGTYYGGKNLNFISDIKVDSQNNIIIVGLTQADTNISTPGSYKTNLTGDYDAFVAKFNDSGAIIWGTYFGGENYDGATSVDVDKSNNIYVVGKSKSITGISINNTFQTQLNQNNSNTYFDGFLAKFNGNGNLVWSSYVGGEDWDELNTIYITDNYLIAGGFSASNNNISTKGVFQEQHDINRHFDGTVYKFTLDGQRIWSTYYGGEQVDYVYAVTTDDQDNVYLGGQTASDKNITTPGSFESSNQSLYRGFMAKLNKNGDRIWGSYLRQAIVYSLIFKNNSIYIGANNSESYSTKLTTLCAYRPTNFYSQGYIGKFTKGGELIWGTYVGGMSTGRVVRIAMDNSNSIFITGISYINDGIADNSSHQSNVLGTENYYLMKFSEDDLTNPAISSNSPVCIGKTLELKASGGTSYSWTGPNGFISTNQNPIINNATSLNSGEYICTITGINVCDGIKKLNVLIGDIEAPIPALATLPAITGDCNTTVTTIPTANDACAGTINATTTSPLSYALPGTYTIVWNYNDGNGNSSTQNQTVTITSQPLPTADPLQTFCVQQNATLSDIQITGQNIKWYSNQTTGTIVPATTVAQDNTTYYASQTINGCESERVPVKINIQVTFSPTGNANQQFCTAQNATITNLEITGTSIKWYDSAINGSLLTETTALEDGKTYYASQTVNNCEGPRFGVTVSIVTTPSVPSANQEQAFCKKENKTLNDIQITGQNIKWFDSNFSAVVLPNTTLLEDNKTYYASQTIGCESDRVPILVHVYDTQLPTGDSNQQFCIDQLATLENLNITGTALKWYDSASNGNLLSETDLLESRTYYVTQTLNNCDSERFAITVKIQDTQIPIADSPQQFCIQKNAKISDIEIIGQNLKWYESVSSSISLSESAPLENGIVYYVSQTISNCESDRIPVTINILEATTGDCINFVDELPFPKFFTPNGDGFNDTWTIESAYLAPNSSIRIFDRYGKFIKELPLNTAWNGTYLGNQQPASDYWFTVTRINGIEFRGHFSLKR